MHGPFSLAVLSFAQRRGGDVRWIAWTEESAGPLNEVGAIPPPPSTPLPLMATLSKAQPSPLLRWQLVEILYSYCLTMHMFNGDWTSHPQVSSPHNVTLLAMGSCSTVHKWLLQTRQHVMAHASCCGSFLNDIRTGVR